VHWLSDRWLGEPPKIGGEIGFHGFVSVYVRILGSPGQSGTVEVVLESVEIVTGSPIPG
jgi:hypothetical protein